MICFIKYLILIFIFFCWNINLILTSTSIGTSPVPGAPVTGTVSPNSPIQKPIANMTDAEKKKAYYIANAQGYCLEFRLSENTVSNYTEYTTERAHYAGPDGADGGNWKDLKQWLLANGFTCTWADKATPIKNGSDELGKDIVRAIRRNLPLPPLPGGSYIAGTLEGGSGKPHGNGEGDSVWYTNTDIDPYGELYFFHESIWLHAGGLYEILLVRPL